MDNFVSDLRVRYDGYNTHLRTRRLFVVLSRDGAVILGGGGGGGGLENGKFL